MKLTSYANNKHQISQLKEAGLTEVILGHKSLSRFSKLGSEELLECLHYANELELKTILEWDILCTEGDFVQMLSVFNTLDKSLFQCVRVQDPGVLEYILEETNLGIQYILETGNHNITGLIKWEEYIGARLERLILSSEINYKKLKEFNSILKTPVEILGLGRILLFYTPRKLLNHLLPEDDDLKRKALHNDDFIEGLGESEESPHKGFPLVENMHGTFMFHVKDLFLFDKKQELYDSGVKFLRVDLRFEESNSLLKVVQDNFFQNYKPEFIKTSYGNDVIRGYFQVNKSDVLFKKLKNYRIQRKDDSYIGEIIEIVKSDYMAIQLKTNSSIEIDQKILLVTPEGKKIETKVFFIKDSQYLEADSSKLGKEGLALINYVGGVWPKSQVYLLK